MLKIAIVDDDPRFCSLLESWILSAKPGSRIDKLCTREDALSAVGSERYDLITVDLDLEKERHAGFAILNAINKSNAVDGSHQTPVLVISGASEPDLYRGVAKELAAWDYLAKPLDQAPFTETFLATLRAAQKQPKPAGGLIIDPLKRDATVWNGQKVRLPLSAQRILNAIYRQRGRVDSTTTYEELFKVVKTGGTKENVRKNVAMIKAAFRDIDPDFNSIETVPMRGYRWVDHTLASTQG